MTAYGVSINIYDHGDALDEQKKRVKCNYCDKVVSGVTRLKCHLAGIRGDVTPCNEVPSEVKEAISNDILNKKKGNLINEVGELSHPDLPWSRNLNNGSEVRQKGASQTNGSVGSPNAKRLRMNHILETDGTESASFRPSGPEDLAKMNFQKCVGRFFIETGTSFDAARAPSFRNMLNAAALPGQICYEIPTPEELETWILQDSVKEMRTRLEEIRSSWPSTGCSILLDGWTNENGRELVNILVECPKGTVYLGSCDISAQMENVESLQHFIEGIIEEVGANNVVQIIAYCISTPMEMVGRQLMEKHRTMFWSVGASHCIELMLERFGMMDVVKEVLEKAKIVTRFVHSRLEVLKILERHNCGQRLVKPSRFMLATPFLTLENIESKKEKLLKMFASSEWTRSISASQVDGKRVADIMKDRSFWTGVTKVLKAATPLLRVLELMNEGKTDKHRLGFIYETMDQVKETIKEEFNNKESQFLPFWESIDHIWNTYLHSPLHSAGYFLNPTFFYSDDFYSDPEVTSGLLCCIVRMAANQSIQDLISFQVDAYRETKGDFAQGCSPQKRSNLPPAIWWSKYATQCPELQKLAIRILSQTCDGASRYGLNRKVAEQLLIEGNNSVVQKTLVEFAFAHYNLHLQNYESGRRNSIFLDEMHTLNDWVVDRTQVLGPLSVSDQLSFFRGASPGVGPSSNFRPKEEPRTY